MPPGVPPPPKGGNRAHERKYAPDTFFSKMIETKVIMRRIFFEIISYVPMPPGAPLPPRWGNRGNEGKYDPDTFYGKMIETKGVV